jgi:hypothetical protein
MCTVTFIPSGDEFFLTSSRDENIKRPAALSPSVYRVNDQQLIFPKDPQGGGSWIVVNEKGYAAVLLNGAFTAHTSGSSYRKSRGMILIEMISAPSPLKFFKKIGLDRIEPFTVILFVDDELYSCIWDGAKKYVEWLAVNQAYIWSSVTLYGSQAIDKRKLWFSAWLKDNPLPAFENIIDFHMKGGDGDSFNNIRMKRDNGLFTNSISSIVISNTNITLNYLDLREPGQSRVVMPVAKPHSVNA